jgi:prepilin-type N-terminal cleavage/methylation domain-containing protein
MMLKNNGFTLIELMIGLFIFSVGILAVTSMQLLSRKQLTVVTRNLGDSVNAASFLERFAGMDYADAMLMDKNGGYKPDEPDYGPFPIGISTSTIQWEVADNIPVEGIKRITVMVRREDSGGIKRVIQYDYVKSLALN